MVFKRITVITGHYGSGKTNTAVNFALHLERQGKNCSVADLDIVNPYFRTADFKEFLHENGIKLTVSKYANSNLDIPSLSFDINAIVGSEYSVIDVGGDDAGASALGRYSEVLSEYHKKNELDMLYVINAYRYLTKEPEEAISLMREIERVSKLPCTGIINNSNLGFETSSQDIANSFTYAERVAEIAKLPIFATTGAKGLLPETAKNPFPVEIYVKNIWN